MKRIFTICILVVAAAMSLMSCQRDPIVYPTGNYYLEVNMDGVTDELEASSLWQVLFYDATTHMKAFETYITPMLHPEDMPTGAYIRGLKAGTYDVVVYNRGTKVTAFNVADASNRIYAYAPNAGYSQGTPIVFEPDNLFVWQSRERVPYVSGDDVYVIKASPKCIIDTREIIVHGIKGLDIAENIALYVSRMDRGSWLCPVKQLYEKVIVVAQGEVRDLKAQTKADGDEEERFVIWTPVSTFGVVDGEEDQRILLTVAIGGPNGSVYYGQADVTDQFLAGQKVIETTLDIEVEPLQQGGFDPTATPWEEFVTKIELM